MKSREGSGCLVVIVIFIVFMAFIWNISYMDTFTRIAIGIGALIFLLILYTIILSITDVAKNGTKAQRDFKSGVKCSENISYVGGFRDLLSKQDGTIKMYDDRLRIILLRKGSLPLKEKIINYKDIVSLDGKSETQISKDVTLTRLVLVGIFAFGIKKTKESTRKFIVITYKESKNEQKLIFECEKAENVIRQYDKLVE